MDFLVPAQFDGRCTIGDIAAVILERRQREFGRLRGAMVRASDVLAYYLQPH